MIFNNTSPVRRYRHREKLTQFELGKAIGRSQCHIYKIEAGIFIPEIELLRKMALAMRCGVEDLTTEEKVNA
jgi:DNA-binding XRE family transcriptional regulator